MIIHVIFILAYDNCQALTVHKMAWYLISILTILMVPLAMLTSHRVTRAFPVLRKRVGAISIATLFKSILFSLRLVITLQRNSKRS